jgi:hypothetical protein
LHLGRNFEKFGSSKKSILKIDNFFFQKVTNNLNLDYVLHQDRRCHCNCMACEGRGFHPVKNCRLECRNSDDLVKKIIILN